MGMDVYGTSPSCDDGKYFRASVWGWRTILRMIEIVDARNDTKLIPYKILTAMGYNDGAGLSNWKQCHKLSDALYEYLNSAEILTDFIIEKNKKGIVDILRIDDMYAIHYEDIKLFIKFLKCCDGFKVY